MQCKLPKKQTIYISSSMEYTRLSTIIYACKNNLVPSTWRIGSTNYITINGTSYQIEVIGKNHDEYADGSGTAPLTFQLLDCYALNKMNSSRTNVGGWADSEMRNTHLPAILALMPSEVQASIREVNKKTSRGDTSSGIVTTADKLFLLSEIEIFGSNSSSAKGEGTQYKRYSNTSVYGDPIKNFNGSATAWWGRSPDINGSSKFRGVGTSGGNSGAYANTARGVSFAFCF